MLYQSIPAIGFIVLVLITAILLLRYYKGPSIISNYLNKMINFYKK